MGDSQIIRMIGVEDHPYIKKWFSGYEYRLTIKAEGVLQFQSLEGGERPEKGIFVRSLACLSSHKYTLHETYLRTPFLLLHSVLAIRTGL